MGTAELFSYDIGTGKKLRLTRNGRNELESSTTFAPDGRHIAFIINVFTGQQGTLHVMDADGSNSRVLLGHDGHLYEDPDWGP